jgi:DNA-binding MarR family transcriptional regulator
MNEPDLPPRHLLHLFLHIGRLLEERLRAPLARAGVHHGQGRVLDALLRQGPLTVGELAAGLQIAQQAAGLLERWIDSDDTRRVTLTLTARGRAAAQSVRRAWQQAEDELCASLPAAERLRLRLLLEGLRDGLGGADPRFAAAREDSNETVAPPARARPMRRPSTAR